MTERQRQDAIYKIQCALSDAQMFTAIIEDYAMNFNSQPDTLEKIAALSRNATRIIETQGPRLDDLCDFSALRAV